MSESSTSIGKILAESWKYFMENIQTIAIIVAIVYLPINIILGFVSMDGLMASQGTWQGFRSYAKIVQILEGFIGIIATTAIAYVVLAAREGSVIPSYDTALKSAVKKWPSVIMTSIVVGLFVILLTLLLIVPGIIYGVYWSFAIYAVIYRDKTGRDAMKYSKEIIQGRWWNTVGYGIVFWLLAIVASFFVGFIEWIALEFVPSMIPTVRFAIEALLDTGTDVVTALFTVVSIVFFLEWERTAPNNDVPVDIPAEAITPTPAQ